MAQFYLATKYRNHKGEPYPATGLFFYEPKSGHASTENPRSFERHIIDTDGKAVKYPGHNNHSEIENVRVRVSAATKPAPLFNTWLALPQDDPEGYLCCVPHEDNARPIGQLGSVRTMGVDRYALSDSVQINILQDALSYRLARGYDRMRKAIEYSNLPLSLANNAAAFWEAIYLVGHNLIAKFSQGTFKDPAWIYHLIRSLTEGFIEGHFGYFFPLHVAFASGEPVIEPANYNTPSRDDWKRVLEHTQAGLTIHNFALPAGLSQGEEEAFRFMANTLANLVQIGNDQEKMKFLSYFIDILTPGKPSPPSNFTITPGEPEPSEFAFWHLHYPHWYVDLVRALNLYGPRPPKASLENQADWDQIAETIMDSFPMKDVSIWDQFVGMAIRSLDSTLIEGALPGKNTDFLVQSIFDHVRSKA